MFKEKRKLHQSGMMVGDDGRCSIGVARRKQFISLLRLQFRDTQGRRKGQKMTFDYGVKQQYRRLSKFKALIKSPVGRGERRIVGCIISQII